MKSMTYVRIGVLLGLAAYFTYTVLTGNITNYVNERFAWLSYVAIAIFAALGAADVYGLLKGNAAQYGQDGYDHNRVTWPVVLIVAVPLMMGTLVPSNPLGADAVNGNISLSVASVQTANVQSVSKAPLDRNVLDWLRAFSQSATLSDFNGMEADVVGFAYREPDFPADHFMVARFTVSCCVADAGAIGIPVYVAGSDASIADGDWVRVRGDFEAGIFRDTKMPILNEASYEIVAQPEHPYLYP